MSPAVVERGVAARADTNYYTGGPFVRATYAKLPEVRRQTWKLTKAGYTATWDLDAERIQTTGRASLEFQDLIGELVTQPRPSSSSGQIAEDIKHRAIPHDNTLSFPGEDVHSVAFSDIEASSDQDLIEAGYRFFTNAEDAELAAASRRSFLQRIGLASD